MSELAAGLKEGATIILDGRALTLQHIRGNVASLRDDSGRITKCDAGELRAIGAGLFGLPGRIEAHPAKQNTSVVAAPAVAEAG